MSDYDDDRDDDSERTEPESTRKNNWRRELETEREQAKQEAAQFKAEGNQARKELAFLKAGIDLNGELTPQQKLFVKAYDGDVTADAVKAAAQEYGVIDAPQQQVPAEELAAHDRFAQASAGAVSQSEGDMYLSQIEKAESVDEVLAALQKIDPNLLDMASNVVPGTWSNGGHQGTPAVRPNP